MVSLLNRKIISLIIIWVLIISSIISIQINNSRAERESCKNEDEKRINYNATRSSKLPINQLTFENYDQMIQVSVLMVKKLFMPQKKMEEIFLTFGLWILMV